MTPSRIISCEAPLDDWPGRLLSQCDPTLAGVTWSEVMICSRTVKCRGSRAADKEEVNFQNYEKLLEALSLDRPTGRWCASHELRPDNEMAATGKH